jgi:putative DNA primase/helicase
VSIILDDIKPEDGGLLDVWETTCAADWLAVGDTFHHFEGTHWRRDECQRARRQIADMMNAINEQARDAIGKLPPKPKEGADEHAGERTHLFALRKATERSNGRVSSVLGLARPLVMVAPDTLDQGCTLNLANGTLDLATRTLRPHNRADLLTYVLPYTYNPAAACPRWRRFLGEVLGRVSEAGEWEPDPDLVRLVQMAVGYTLTNDTRHEKMFWLCGEGANGKTTLLSVLMALLGDLATLADFHAMGQPGNYELVRLRGKRLALSTEATKGRGLAETILKRVVTGERIAARQIFEPVVEFTAVAKVWWAMNDKPAVRDTSNALWRRLALIPFNRTFAPEEQDRGLGAALLNELPGILNWALDGLAALRQAGCFPEVAAVTRAVEDYRLEANATAQWLEERCTPARPDGQRLDQRCSPEWTSAQECYKDFAPWAARNAHAALTSTAFGSELVRLVPRRREPGSGRTQYQLGLLYEPSQAEGVKG